jgi:hypothetical protein
MDEIDGFDGFKRTLGVALTTASLAPVTVARPPRSRSYLPWRIAVPVVAAAAVVVMVVVGVFGRADAPGGSSPRPRSAATQDRASAAGILLTAARAPALRAGYRSLGPHQYWYERTRITEPGPIDHEALITSTQTYWTARDGARRARVSAARTAGGRRVWRASTKTDRVGPRPFAFGLAQVSYHRLVSCRPSRSRCGARCR